MWVFFIHPVHYLLTYLLLCHFSLVCECCPVSFIHCLLISLLARMWVPPFVHLVHCSTFLSLCFCLLACKCCPLLCLLISLDLSCQHVSIFLYLSCLWFVTSLNLSLLARVWVLLLVNAAYYLLTSPLLCLCLPDCECCSHLAHWLLLICLCLLACEHHLLFILFTTCWPFLICL